MKMDRERFKVLMDHYRHPRNFGELEDADAKARETNPICGDVVEIYLKVRDGRISDVRFKGYGCAVSQASASLLTDNIKGMGVDEVKRLDEEYVVRLVGEEVVSEARRSCAVLSLRALKKALSEVR